MICYATYNWCVVDSLLLAHVQIYQDVFHTQLVQTQLCIHCRQSLEPQTYFKWVTTADGNLTLGKTGFKAVRAKLNPSSLDVPVTAARAV